MYSITESRSNQERMVPAFLNKLWSMVNDPSTDSVIGWSEDGTEFYIRNQSVFFMELLPLFYKHNNMASFVRQLNMYGFKKLTPLTVGNMRSDSNELIFYHVSFIRDHPELLMEIRRRTSVHAQRAGTNAEPSPNVLLKLYAEVQNLKSKQESVDSHLGTMKRENESLWREVLVLRQRHSKQQQIVNKLIQFLVSMVQPTTSGHRAGSNIGVKRKQLPMLAELGDATSVSSAVPSTSAAPASKAPRLARTHPLHESEDVMDTNSSGILTSNASPGGPVIHDVTDLLSPTAPGSTGESAVVISPDTGDEAATEAGVAGSGTLPGDQWPAVDTSQLSDGGGSGTIALNTQQTAATPLVCDTLLEEIQADLDGLRGLIGNTGGSSSGSWQDVLMTEGSGSSGSGAAGPSAGLCSPRPDPTLDNQLMPYSPSLYELLSAGGAGEEDLFPELPELAGFTSGNAPQNTSASNSTTAIALPEYSFESSDARQMLNTPILDEPRSQLSFSAASPADISMDLSSAGFHDLATIAPGIVEAGDTDPDDPMPIVFADQATGGLMDASADVGSAGANQQPIHVLLPDVSSPALAQIHHRATSTSTRPSSRARSSTATVPSRTAPAAVPSASASSAHSSLKLKYPNMSAVSEDQGSTGGVASSTVASMVTVKRPKSVVAGSARLQRPSSGCRLPVIKVRSRPGSLVQSSSPQTTPSSIQSSSPQTTPSSSGHSPALHRRKRQ